MDPATATASVSRIVDVAAGFQHTCFLGQDGRLLVAGRNHLGALGREDRCAAVRIQFRCFVVCSSFC